MFEWQSLLLWWPQESFVGIVTQRCRRFALGSAIYWRFDRYFERRNKDQKKKKKKKRKKERIGFLDAFLGEFLCKKVLFSYCVVNCYSIFAGRCLAA